MYSRSPLFLVALLFMGLGIVACGDDTVPNNKLPILTGPFTETPEVTSGTQVALTLSATDPDGDSLTYEWLQTPATPAGTFSDAAAASPTWTAPDVTGATSFQLGVSVSDNKAGTIRRTVTVRVLPRPPTNRPPVITAGTPRASPSSVTGSARVQLTLTATDPDSDSLIYTWSQEPATPVGIFSSISASSPTWDSPVVTTATRFTLRVTVSDGREGTVQAEVHVDVAPPGSQNNAPVLTSGPSTSAATINSQQSVNLSVVASDPDGDPLTYSWGQTPTSPAGAFSNAAVSNPSWTAPTVTSDTTFQLRVTVSDGQGGVASGTVSVTVRAPANRPPTISQAASANPTSVTGAAPVQLAVTATDPDGDTLTYAWTQTPATPAGSFTSTSVRNPTWTSPEVTTTTRFTLGVTITDGRGGSVQSQVGVDVAPPIPANRPPALTGPTANPTTLDYQQLTNISLTATDPDGDPLTYAWTQSPATPAGSFSSTTVASPTWTAPRVTTNTAFQLRVAVSDGRGGTTNGSASVNVNAFVNSPPTITAGPSASSTTIDEQTSITLSVTASDANGDPLTYAWTQTAPASPVGSFSSASVANPSWTAPDVTANGTYTLRVTISDGQGGSVQGSINITVQKVNQPPTVSPTITGPSTLLAGNTGTFSITASDPDGDTLSYAWSQTVPATPQGTFMGSTTGSSAQWYSPELSTETSFTLTVTVTDGQSPPEVRTITFPVTMPRYGADIQSIWSNVPCTSCHGGSGNLNLNAPGSHANLVNAPSFGACVPGTRIIPGDPDNSVLVRKISGTSCGGRMPQSDPGYFAANPGLLIRIRSWVLAGAAND